jgi:asparagine synthase (glutamine-hydrolysing)
VPPRIAAPDGIEYCIDGNAGLAHLAFHTTPESMLERQPSAYVNGRYILAADARIDNRDELLPQLFPKYTPRDYPTIPDTDIIFAAYMKWNAECPKALLGDFAFVIWDKKEQRFFAARDTMGMRSLFYFAVGKKLVLANSLDSVLPALGATPDLNLPWIEDFVRCDRGRWI